MADIMVKISSIQGESAMANYENQIECNSVRHAIDLPVVARGAARTEGASRHGAVVLTHVLDKATPLLKFAASSGTNLGKVEITKLRTVGGQPKAAEVITLENAFATRVETHTPVDAQTGRPGEELMESFSLEYSDIRWRHTHHVDGQDRGSVEGGWSVSRQTSL